MNNRELKLSKGFQFVDKAKEFEKHGSFDHAAKEYRKARDIFNEIGQNKLYAQCLAAHVLNKVKYYLAGRDIELLPSDLIDSNKKKLDVIDNIRLSKIEKYEIYMKAYRELEKVFADHHMIEDENEMYYKRTSLDYKCDWQRGIQKDYKFIKRIWDFFSSFINFCLYIYCGHGAKPRRAVGWIASIILSFAFLFHRFDLIEIAKCANPVSFWQSLYFSVITFTTLGYGDIVPINTAGQIAVIAEVTLGVLSLGLLLASLTRKFTK